MPAEQFGVRLEIRHVLFLDIVSYSKLVITQQTELLHKLTAAVSETEQFQIAEQQGRLIRLPTGDGMALVFRGDPEAPVQCASELARRLKSHPELPVRMGIHSGPVNEVTDVNGRTNITGAGINVAQRIMDCGDAGHILLSKHVADDLEQYPEWREHLHDLGPIEVKHGRKLDLVSFHNAEVGNASLPEKVKQAAKASRAIVARKRRRVLAGTAALLAIASMIGLWIFFKSPGRNAVPISDKSIAVLPLENLSEEKENAYFADGVQDELLSNLAKIKDLKVISRTSVMQYKTGVTRNLKEIAQQLGVSNVVEGSVRRSGNQIRVSVQLIDALNDRHIWVQNYDRTLADSLALQGELATEIAAGVGATLSAQEKARVEATPTKHTGAYDAYLRGRAFTASLESERSNVEGAIQSYQEAVKLDPGFALAWAFLSSERSLSYWEGFDSTRTQLAAAKEALDRAVALDSNLPETHLALGYYRYYGLRDFRGALGEFQKAEQGLPNNVEVLKAIGLIQRRMGHWDEAVAAFRRAVELDPRSIPFATMLATSYGAVRHYSEAIAIWDHLLALDPSNAGAIEAKAWCLWLMGRFDAADSLLTDPKASSHIRGHQAMFKGHYAEAADLFSKALKEMPGEEQPEIIFDLALAQQRAGNAPASKATYQHAVQQLSQKLKKEAGDPGNLADTHSFLGIAYAGLGEAASAISEGRKGMAIAPSSEDPFEGSMREARMARIYAMLGNADDAIGVLKRWIAVPSLTEISPASLRIDPRWDPIRNDPRFVELTSDKTR